MFQEIILEVFAQLPSGKTTGPSEIHFLKFFPLNFLNLVLIADAKSNGHQGTWTGCIYSLWSNVLFYVSMALLFQPIYFDSLYFCYQVLLFAYNKYVTRMQRLNLTLLLRFLIRKKNMLRVAGGQIKKYILEMKVRIQKLLC